MKFPQVDVVLLSWNRSQMTLETIHSLLEQQDVETKIWIVDQGSRPEELALLEEATREYKNVHIEKLPKNIGVPGGRNVGTRLGTAPYTVSIDNDAVFDSNLALKQVVHCFEQNPKVGVISFRIKNFYTGLDDELSWVYPSGLKEKRESQFLATRFVGCGHAIRRDVFEKVGGYDDDLFFYWEEVDFSYRVINLGFELIYDPSIQVLHKVSPEARVRWEDKRFYYLVRNAIYISLKYDQSLLSVLVKALGYILKGAYNGLQSQAFSGIIDGVNMSRSHRSKVDSSALPLLKMTNSAKEYIWNYETRYRGSFWNRLRREVFVGLPGRA